MKKIFIFCLFAIVNITMSYAHNPLSAMYYIEVEDGFGILNVSLSQAGVHEAIFKAYSEDELGKLSEIEYKQMIVWYVKDRFNITINGNQIELLNGGVKLGNHQTDLKFITSELPEIFKTLEARIDAFKENEHHQTILSIKLNDKTSKVILSENNKYSTSMSFVDNQMVANSRQFENNYLWFFAIIPIFIIARKVIPYQK